MPFTPVETVPVDLLPDGRLRLLADLRWTGSHGDMVLIERGKVTDLATEPRVVQGVVPHDGPISRAAIVHDELCDRLNAYRKARAAYEAEWAAPGWPAEGTPARAAMQIPVPPTFNAIDTDGVFRLILGELGTGPIRWIYWCGVRWGALGNPARRAGWLRTAPAVLALSLPTLLVMLPGVIGSAWGRAWIDLVTWGLGRFARRKPHAAPQVAAMPGGRIYMSREVLEGPIGPDPRAVIAAAYERADSRTVARTLSGCTCGPGWGHALDCPVAPPLPQTALSRAEEGIHPAAVDAFRAGWRACHTEMTRVHGPLGPDEAGPFLPMSSESAPRTGDQEEGPDGR